MTVYSNLVEIKENLESTNMGDILTALYCFVDDFLKMFLQFVLPYVTKPDRKHPPTRYC